MPNLTGTIIHVTRGNSAPVHAAYAEGKATLCGQHKAIVDLKVTSRPITCSQCRLIRTRIPG
jgi:hypothetical protein